MRRTLLGVVAATLVPATLGVPGITAATAAPACRGGVVDGTGDAPSPDLDIVAVDTALGAKYLVVGLRVVGLAPAVGTGSLPASWTVAFSARGVAYTAFRKRSPDGGFAYGLSAGGTPVQVATRTDRTSIYWSVPRRALPRVTSICAVSATTALVGVTADSAA